ncbi:globin domain-containing protein [Gemella bergeri]
MFNIYKDILRKLEIDMNLYNQIGERNIDLLVSYMYDDIIPNDDRINVLFSNGFDRIKEEQKKFFRLFLGEPGHSIFNTPNLKKKHINLPISINEAKYWFEDFEIALNRLEIDPAIKKFLSQKVNALTVQMINTIK